MRILILYSDTGGGHRAASKAIQAALQAEEPTVEIELRDGLVEAGGWPLNRAPAIYAFGMTRARTLWAFLFYFWNGPFRARLMADLGYPLVRNRLRRLLVNARPDIVVSVHPLLTRTIRRALRAARIEVPFAIVVTDLVSGHEAWYEQGVDHLFVPTPELAKKLEAGGFDPARLTVTGQAVSARCGEAAAQRTELRTRFGWTEPVILMVGGGDGVGPLGRYVRAAAEARLPARLIVVCGRNERLRRELEGASLSGPIEIHGFVDNLHELMAASDILVTKGGPGSIMEGCIAGLPMLIYDYLPGQEVGNIRFAEERGFGKYVPSTRRVVAELRRWIDHPEERLEAARRARAAGMPDSARNIAQGILTLAHTRSERGVARGSPRS